MAELGPVAPRERVEVLDVLRGIALCGVLIGNLYYLYSGAGFAPGHEPEGIDQVASWWVAIFVQSKAQTLLTFLFGFGFAAQLVRAQARNEPVVGVYLRRMFALLAIGVMHVTLIWWGDVTWTYAVSGFGLLLFLRASDRTRIIAAFLLVLVPFLVWMVPAVAEAAARLFVEPGAGRKMTEELRAVMTGGDYVATIALHAQFAPIYVASIYLWYFPWLLGRFLIGYVAGRQGWFARDGADHLPLFRRLLGYGLIVAGAATGVTVARLAGAFDGYELYLPTRMALAALRELGLLAMTGVYIAIIVLLVQRPAWRRVLRLVAPAGRMPLTAYVAQSLICVPLFYDWGAGLVHEGLGPAARVGLAIGIFAVEVALCHLWLRAFRFGPLEWVWRTLVYWKAPPMRA